MTTISAKAIAKSAWFDDLRNKTHTLTTFELIYPRIIHSEFMTHRVFSRNASSSRAIPVERQLEMIRKDPFIPLHWGKNQKGMQAFSECNERIKSWYFHPPHGSSWDREEAWLFAMHNALKMAEAFSEAGYHKQLVNRLVEPFSHIKVVASATELDNFFALRTHEDAEPHIQRLACEISKTYHYTEAEILKPGQWHLPYITEQEKLKHSLEDCQKVSTARCARTSYFNFDGTVASFEKDCELFNKLTEADPIHASPLEHVATPTYQESRWKNFKGFQQLRLEYDYNGFDNSDDT